MTRSCIGFYPPIFFTSGNDGHSSRGSNPAELRDSNSAQQRGEGLKYRVGRPCRCSQNAISYSLAEALRGLRRKRLEQRSSDAELPCVGKPSNAAHRVPTINEPMGGWAEENRCHRGDLVEEPCFGAPLIEETTRDFDATLIGQ